MYTACKTTHTNRTLIEIMNMVWPKTDTLWHLYCDDARGSYRLRLYRDQPNDNIDRVFIDDIIDKLLLFEHLEVANFILWKE